MCKVLKIVLESFCLGVIIMLYDLLFIVFLIDGVLVVSGNDV